MSGWPNIRDLIPHQAPMLWLDQLLAWRPGFARCQLQVRADSAFVEDGVLPGAVLLEHMAQAVAVCLGYAARQNGEAIRVGMVVACKSFELHRAQVPVGTELVVEATCLREMDAVSHFDCKVLTESALVATAHLLLYHAAEPPS